MLERTDKQRAYSREWVRKRRAQLKAAGLCGGCKTQPVVQGRSSCQACLLNDSVRSRIKANRWKAQGRCQICTRRDARPNKIHCQECAQIHQAKQRPLKLQRIAERLASGICLRCGKEPHLDTLSPEAKQKLCERCYLMHIAGHNLGDGKRWKELKSKLVSQNFKCAYTGMQLILGINASIDHIQPVSRFPHLRCEADNVEWVDLKVNLMKRNLTRDEFIELMQEIIKYRSSQANSLP